MMPFFIAYKYQKNHTCSTKENEFFVSKDLLYLKIE